MHKWILSAAALLAGALLQAQTPQWHWEKAGKGVQYCAQQVELFGRTEFISAVRFKMYRHRTRILHAPGDQADSTSALAQKAGAIAAVNGSYFNMKTLVPTTYLKKRYIGETIPTLPSETYRTDGVLALKGTGFAHIIPCDTTQYAWLDPLFIEAIASGPVLLQDGKPVRSEWPKSGFFTKHHPRTLVGKDKRNRFYFIVIDGRFPGQGDGASIDETVQIAQMFGLQEALNLDGGGSCALWTRKTGVLSHPYDNHRFDHYGQRVVPNILYIR